MTSTDREILIAINDRIEHIGNRQQGQGTQIAEMRRDIIDIKQEQRILRHDIDNLQTFMYAIGIFLTAVAVIPAVFGIASLFRRAEPPKDDKVSLTLSQFGALITDRLLESRKGDSK